MRDDWKYDGYVGDPDEIEKFTNDDVFKESFWNEISDQAGSKTSCLANESVNVDKFMSIPMDEGPLTFILSTLIFVQNYQRKWIRFIIL